MKDIHQYDDGDFDSAIETDHTIKVGTAPTVNNEVLRYQDIPALGTILSSTNVITDNSIVRGDGGTRGVQGSLATISDAGTINIPAGQSYDVNGAARGDVFGPAASVDNGIARYDGVTGKLLQQALATILDSGAIRFTNSIYWTYHKLPASEFIPSSSGATWVDPNANTLGGYNLDADTEYLYINFIMCSDWDAASDAELICWFETDVDNSGGNIGDKVVFDAECYVKDIGDTACLTQSLSEDIIIDQAAQYKLFNFTFTIDYDNAGAPLSVGSVVTVRLNFDRTNSNITSVIFNRAIFRYKTKQVHIEV